MGDKIVILNITFLHNELFRIELHNENKNESYCAFVKKEDFYNMLNSAIEKGEKNGKIY